ncbi:MAG: ectonucleotide pyrophosphatase/phosphodiesterase [Balneolaceae bacterium]|nr:ectonucleotide pyrophosphatase/phosphodiesterase [Balneolaceae bacterium]
MSVGCEKKAVENNRRGDKLLLISLDGFGYDYLSKADTPHFDAFVREGVISRGLIPVVPSKTFPNHYSIVTGLYPENNGLVNNTMYDPAWDKWYRISDRNAVENGEWYQGEPIWITAEQQGLTTGTMFWGGSEADIQGMHPTYWKRYDEDMSYKARIDTVVSWFTRSRNPIDFGTLYVEHVDSYGHRYGIHSDSLVAAIERSDNLLGYLQQRLSNEGLWDEMNIMIVSDHGMVEQSAGQTIILDTIINMDDLARYTLDPVTMLQPDSGKVDQVYQQLKQAEEHYRVFKKEDLPDRYHLKNHRRVMDLVLVAETGYMILTGGNKQRFIDNLPSATHGYDNSTPKMQALFAARGPAFASGDTIPSFQNIHLYELMARVMKLKPAPNDGSLDSVRVVLQ